MLYSETNICVYTLQIETTVVDEGEEQEREHFWIDQNEAQLLLLFDFHQVQIESDGVRLDGEMKMAEAHQGVVPMSKFVLRSQVLA